MAWHLTSEGSSYTNLNLLLLPAEPILSSFASSAALNDLLLHIATAGASQKLGISCAMPGAFQNALLVASTAKSYSEGIRTNMVAGGDNCSRSVYLGALLGAAYGVDAVPADWKSKVTGWSEFEAAVNAVVQ